MKHSRVKTEAHMADDDDDTEFANALYNYCDVVAENAGLLAMRFGYKTAEVRSWASGRSAPHPSVQKKVLAYIRGAR